MLEAELESRKAGSWRKGRKLLIITYTHMLQEVIIARAAHRTVTVVGRMSTAVFVGLPLMATVSI